MAYGYDEEDDSLTAQEQELLNRAEAAGGQGAAIGGGVGTGLGAIIGGIAGMGVGSIPAAALGAGIGGTIGTAAGGLIGGGISQQAEKEFQESREKRLAPLREKQSKLESMKQLLGKWNPYF